jgi:hypothetical protein
MYYIAAAIALVFWMFGLLYHYSMGGFLNLLPAIAVLLILLRIFSVQSSYGFFTGARLENRIGSFGMPKTVSVIIFAGGLAMLMMGLNGVEHLHSDASQFFNGTASESVFWMLIGGNIACIIGTVTLIVTLRKEIKTKNAKRIRTGLSQ